MPPNSNSKNLKLRIQTVCLRHNSYGEEALRATLIVVKRARAEHGVRTWPTQALRSHTLQDVSFRTRHKTLIKSKKVGTAQNCAQGKRPFSQGLKNEKKKKLLYNGFTKQRWLLGGCLLLCRHQVLNFRGLGEIMRALVPSGGTLRTVVGAVLT